MSRLSLRVSLAAGGALLSACLFAIPAARAETPDLSASTSSPVLSVEPVAVPVIFQMNDGRFYHPSSGLFASTKEELLLMLAAQSTTTVFSATNTVVITNQPVQSTTTIVIAVDPLLAAVRRARAMLDADVAADQTSSTKVVSTDDGSRDVVLAVWNRTTDEMVKVSVKKKGGSVRVKQTVPYKIRVARSAKLNSEYTIDDPQMLVVAVRYPVYTEIAKTKKKTTYRVEDVVYVPYAAALRTAEIIENGKQFFQRQIDQAYIDFNRAKVVSRAVSGKFVTDIIDQTVVKTITAIEHVDRSTAVNNSKLALDVFFVTLGTNEERAYRYDLSSAGAHGLAQFMPATYKALAKRSEYGLETDFDKGMDDPENAVKAQVAYLDLLMAELPDDIVASASSTAQRDEMAVAAYNAGAARVRKAAANWDRIFDPSREAKRLAAKQEYDTAFANAEDAKEKMKQATDPKKAAEYGNKLARYRKQYRAAEKRVNTLAVSGLKKETVDYIKKYRALLPYMQSLENMASTEPVPPTAG